MRPDVAPYRESDGPAIAERACPKCGAHVSYPADATSAMCTACDTRFAILVEHLSDGLREPREFQTVPTTPPTTAIEVQARDAAPRGRRELPAYIQVAMAVAMVGFICLVPLIGAIGLSVNATLLAAAIVSGTSGVGLGALLWKTERRRANQRQLDSKGVNE